MFNGPEEQDCRQSLPYRRIRKVFHIREAFDHDSSRISVHRNADCIFQDSRSFYVLLYRLSQFRILEPRLPRVLAIPPRLTSATTLVSPHTSTHLLAKIQRIPRCTTPTISRYLLCRGGILGYRTIRCPSPIRSFEPLFPLLIILSSLSLKVAPQRNARP
jgi:hypothetical protein